MFNFYFWIFIHYKIINIFHEIRCRKRILEGMWGQRQDLDYYDNFGYVSEILSLFLFFGSSCITYNLWNRCSKNNHKIWNLIYNKIIYMLCPKLAPSQCWNWDMIFVQCQHWVPNIGRVPIWECKHPSASTGWKSCPSASTELVPKWGLTCITLLYLQLIFTSVLKLCYIYNIFVCLLLLLLLYCHCLLL